MGKNLIYMHAYRTLHIIYIYTYYIVYCFYSIIQELVNDKSHKSHKSLRWRSGCFAVDFRKNFMLHFLFIWQDTRRVCSTRNQQIVLHDMKCRKGIDFLDFENRYTVTVRVYIYIYIWIDMGLTASIPFFASFWGSFAPLLDQHPRIGAWRSQTQVLCGTRLDMFW